jgi:hypothetical protein
MREGSQGTSAAHGMLGEEALRLEGRETSLPFYQRVVSRIPSGRGRFCKRFPGAALRLPLATLFHPFGVGVRR